MDILSVIIFGLYTMCSVLLLLYGLNTYFIICLFLRKRDCGASDKAIEASYEANFREAAKLPIVTTQIPLFNELNVAERIIRAVAEIEYPKNRHEIQILDDSDDETREIVDQVAAELCGQGHWVEVLRRKKRIGYKAGALEAGMKRCQGKFIAIFDSDFIPPKEFLKRTLPHLWKDSHCALVQARWDHINMKQSWLTRAQAIGIDGHFVVEQTARNRNGLFMNFCGTAGIWRRKAIEDAGGWQHDTVTEDLDLSYRAQLKGWNFHYLPGLRVPGELPPTYNGFKSQQYRWAKGTMQTARKILPTVWRAPISTFKKLQATVHLTHYSLHLQMALLALLVLPLMLSFREGVALYKSVTFLALLIPAAFGPSLGYVVCQYYGHPEDWKKRLIRLPFLLVIGFGICFSNAKAVLQGLFGQDSTFVRTPKAGEKKLKHYTVKRNRMPHFELLFAIYCAVTVAVLISIKQLALVPFVVIYFFGFSVVGYQSLAEIRLRNG